MGLNDYSKSLHKNGQVKRLKVKIICSSDFTFRRERLEIFFFLDCPFFATNFDPSSYIFWLLDSWNHKT